MSAIIWSEWDVSQENTLVSARVTGTTKDEYIEVSAWTATGGGIPAVQTEFEVKIWGRLQSTGGPPSHSIIGAGGIEWGKKAAEHLLDEGLERF